MAYDINARSSNISAYTIGLIGVSSFILQPGVVGAFVEHLGFTDPQAGSAVGIEMFGVAVTAILMGMFPTKINWRSAAKIFILLVIIGNLSSLITKEFNIFSVTRFIAGLGYGGLISLGFVAIGMTDTPDRNFGTYLVIVMIYGALGLFTLPSIIGVVGLNGFFMTLALLAVMGLFFVKNMPTSGNDRLDIPPDAINISKVGIWSALTAIFAYNLGVGIIWAYAFLVGLESGFAEQEIANVIGVSQFFGITGAFLTMVLATKFGRIAPLTVGILGAAVIVLLLLDKPVMSAFFIGICAFNFFWNFSMPYILSSLASCSTSGDIMTKDVSSQMLATAIAPLLGAWLLNKGMGYNEIIIVGSVAFAFSFVLILPSVLQHRKILAEHLKLN